LNAEIADELGLVGTGGFEATPSHEQKNHRAVEFVARTKIYGGLVVGGMESRVILWPWGRGWGPARAAERLK
jgi:hypothetical protein